jgi:hypothetical protein
MHKDAAYLSSVLLNEALTRRISTSVEMGRGSCGGNGGGWGRCKNGGDTGDVEDGGDASLDDGGSDVCVGLGGVPASGGEGGRAEEGRAAGGCSRVPVAFKEWLAPAKDGAGAGALAAASIEVCPSALCN